MKANFLIILVYSVYSDLSIELPTKTPGRIRIRRAKYFAVSPKEESGPGNDGFGPSVCEYESTALYSGLPIGQCVL